MTSDDYRATLAALGLTQNAGGELLGVDPRTSRKWANGERDIPPPAVRFLRYLVHVGADPAKVRAILDGGEIAAERPAPGVQGSPRPRVDDGNPPGPTTDPDEADRDQR